MKVTILGIGAWGTALAKLLSEQGCQVTLWGHDSAQVDRIRSSRDNPLYLPGIELPRELHWESDLQHATAHRDLLVFAVASRFLRETASALPNSTRTTIVTVTKGIENNTGLTMSAVLEQLLPQARITALSGPTLAPEVARGIPTAIVAASRHPEAAKIVQHTFHRPAFRVYTSPDPLGVELGGALKNVIAIAAGVGDGLGYGDNTKAALITRGIAEIRRLGTACGAQPETFAGLSGLGDLTVTCFSKLSRNRTFGERLGRGETVPQILSSMLAVAEGVPTARAAHQLARRLAVPTPIIDEVHAMIHEGKDIAQAVQDLIQRVSKPEN
jgi:glycerol-3-phosphate dehydrogenase (NAD(P)+)